MFVCLFVQSVHVNMRSRNSWNVVWKHLVIWEGDPVTTHKGWGKLEMPTCPSKCEKEFFFFFIFCFVSTNFNKIILLWKSFKKHLRMTNIFLLGIALIDRVAISKRRKEVFFKALRKSYKIIAWEKNIFSGPFLGTQYRIYLKC